MDHVLDILSWIMFSIGGLFVLTGGIGALRMPDFYTRLHAAGLTDTLGTLFVLGGAMLQSGWSLASVKLLTIMVFLLLSSPTAAYALANAARLGGLAPKRMADAEDEE